MKATGKILTAMFVMAMLVACVPAPAPAPSGPDYGATLDVVATKYAALDATITAREVTVKQATPVPPPVATLVPAPHPQYVVVECGTRPPNGTLIRMLTSATTRVCHSEGCGNRGQVKAGTVAALVSVGFDGDGRTWYRFSFLPTNSRPYGVEIQWLKAQDTECVEPWVE